MGIHGNKRSFARAAKALFLVLALLLPSCQGISPQPSGAETAPETELAVGTESAAQPHPVVETAPEQASNVRFVPPSAFPEATARAANAEEETVILALNGVPLPEAEGTAYLPVRSAGYDPRSLLGLSAGHYDESGSYLEDADAVILADEAAAAGIGDFLSDNIALDIRILSGESVSGKRLVFTTLPVLELKRTGRKFSFTPAPADFSLWEAAENGVKRTDSAAMVKTRGATSATLPKHGYRIELRGADDQPRRLPLLGMRRDDDWVLCASYSDNTHVRDALSWKIWSEMAADAGLTPSGAVETRFTEAIIAGEYAGFYLLMERVDAKQLSLGSDDALFKTIDWSLASSDALRSASPSDRVTNSLEKKHPDEPGDGWNGWDVMAEFIRLSYESDGETFAAGIEKIAEPENMIEYWLFLNLIMGADNAYKNAYFAVIDGRVEVFPWDLDITFGLAWNGDRNNNYLYENLGNAKNSFDFKAGHRLVKYCPAWRAYALKRYDALKEAGIADAEHIISLAEGIWNELHDSGAWARNLERWPDTNTTNSLAYLKRVVHIRMEWMDEMMESWRG